MKYWISTTGEELTQNYNHISGGWEFVTSGYGQDGARFERYETETDRPAAFESLLDSDASVLMYGAIGDEDRDV